ncbi:MAG: AEC family transporter [Brachybacterium tyrofermentans]|uniref:AEC family transporter n=1 Tax=Brachybacterium tyrofermentans TaxID=47848 RepID=A0ABW0FBT5_9MICO|nr:AEC family transporter [Brachybacterium tyrofermentans]SLN01571.1 putative membrane protein [Corynebacterium xerosis]
MTGVLAGFFIVWSLIAVGWVAGRTGVLGPHGRYVLNRATFFIASPALVLVGLLSSDLREIFSVPMAVAGISGLATGGLLILGVRLFTKRRGTELVVAAISGSVVNGANMGFPIAAYVLGDISHALPVILFQQAVYNPLYLFVLHQITEKESLGPKGVARSIGANPTIIAAAVGMVLAVLGVKIPGVVLEPIQSLADMAIPAMLLAYGLSLHGSRPLAKDDGYRGLIAVSSSAKLLVMPLIALGIGLLFGLSGHSLYEVVVMAALPTAQNVYVAAARYRAAENLARDTVLITTIGTVVVLLLISGLLGV